MLRQMCRRARLNVTSHDEFQEASVQTLFKTLRGTDSGHTTTSTLTAQELALFLAKGHEIDAPTYNAILRYLISLGQPWHPYNQVPPHPDRNWILPPRGSIPSQVVVEEKTYSCDLSHHGNSVIMFYNPQDANITYTGVIHTICQVPLHSALRTYFIVHLHQDLPPHFQVLSPYTLHTGFASKLVETSPSDYSLVIEPQHIITHLTTYKRPAGTFNIPRETLAICWALNRGRK